MALITCPECGKQISDLASECIHCGYPIAKNASVEKEAPKKKIDRKVNLKLAGLPKPVIGAIALAVLVIAGYAFWYAPNYIPREVESRKLTVAVDGSEKECLFTGTTLAGVPQGEGLFAFTDGSSQWSFKGSLSADGSLAKGYVTKKPFSISTTDGTFRFKYTGNIENGLPSEAFEVDEMPFDCVCDGSSISGYYSGEMLDMLPHGQGSFIYKSGDDYFTYKGAWEKGQLKGAGQVHTNIIPVHSTGLDRLGEYTGDMVDGVFAGNGEFTALTDDGESYTYTGQWERGVWHGQGSCVYESGLNMTGTYKDGDFAPTVSEYYVSYGTIAGQEYTVSAFARNHLDQFSHDFIGNDSAKLPGLEVNTSFSYTAFSKNPQAYNEGVIKLTGLRIFQIFESEDEWGYESTTILANRGDNEIYFITLLGSTGKQEDDVITIYALPLDYFSYSNVSGGRTWAIRCAGVYIR